MAGIEAGSAGKEAGGTNVVPMVRAVACDVTAKASRQPRAKGTRKRPAKGRKMVRWSARRERLFLETLIETAKVAAAIRASGFSETNVYRKRRTCAEFRAKWAAALREGYVRLETLLLDRAINGVEKTVWHGGKAVGTMREYSDRLALALLSAHRSSVTGVPEPIDAEAEAEIRARLKERLSEMNRAMGGAG